MDIELKRKMYIDVLVKNGYVAKKDNDGDITFKKNEHFLFIGVDDDDGFFRLCLPNHWTADSEKYKTLLLIACDYSNKKSKVAKTYTNNNKISTSVEIYLKDPAEFELVFDRCIKSVLNGARHFKIKLKELVEAELEKRQKDNG